jgi:hypothetical protein
MDEKEGYCQMKEQQLPWSKWDERVKKEARKESVAAKSVLFGFKRNETRVSEWKMSNNNRGEDLRGAVIYIPTKTREYESIVFG